MLSKVSISQPSSFFASLLICLRLNLFTMQLAPVRLLVAKAVVPLARLSEFSELWLLPEAISAFEWSLGCRAWPWIWLNTLAGSKV